ncbi:MAG: hypothetical protein LBQ52_06715 [Helicobacteraceae bacterium]|nr:hypothetical protein [Helicobacteraceae bacterium]
MKIWTFAFFLMIASLIASFALSPENREGGEQTKTARMEFENYKIYSIDKEIVSSVLIAQSGLVFDDREELVRPTALRQIGQTRDSLSSLSGTIKGDLLILNGDVNYWDSLGRTLKTESAEYNRTSGILKGDKDFMYESPNGVMSGESFVVDNAKREITANQIKAILNDETP